MKARPSHLPGQNASLIAERFLRAYEKIAQSNRQCLQELDRILTAFQAADIVVLPLKGADLLGRAYGVLGLRPMVDVDLLFRPKDFTRIDRILRAHAFEPRVHTGNPTYVSATRQLCIDLFSEIWYCDEVDVVWQRMVSRRLAGHMRPAMHPEDALIYLVAYQTVHRGRLSLQMAMDLAALLDAEAQFINWRNVIHQATSSHLRLPLFHGLSYAYAEAGAKIPPQVLEALRPTSCHWLLLGLYQRLVTERGIPNLGHFLLVFSRPGLRKKIHALWKGFFPSREFLTMRYGHKTLYGRFWKRVTRPIDLLLHGGLLLLRISHDMLFSRKRGLQRKH